MAECHVKFIYKRNAFLIIFEAILRFWLKKSSFSTGFIRVFATRFCTWGNSKFDRFYKVSRRSEIVLRKPYKHCGKWMLFASRGYSGSSYAEVVLGSELGS